MICKGLVRLTSTEDDECAWIIGFGADGTNLDVREEGFEEGNEMGGDGWGMEGF